jgi:PAS domain-containing protein
MPRTEGELTGLLLDALNTAVAVLDRSLRVLAWNAWLAGASGISVDEAVGRTFEELFPGRTLHRLTEATREAVGSGHVSEISRFRTDEPFRPWRGRGLHQR